jgi:hypothetical protein
MVNLGQSPVGVGGRDMDPQGFVTLKALRTMHQVFDGEGFVLKGEHCLQDIRVSGVSL